MIKAALNFLKSHGSQILWVFSFSVFLVSEGLTANLNASVNVINTATLDMGGLSTFAFPNINYANFGSQDQQSFSSVKAYSNSTTLHLSMTSNTPSDASGNPQLQDSASPPNLIPYTVSYQPCYQPGKQAVPPTLALTTNSPVLIPTPYSYSSACSSVPGGIPGVLSFTRLSLSILPPAGLYTNILTFTVTEP